MVRYVKRKNAEEKSHQEINPGGHHLMFNERLKLLYQ
jgi:hypothetical protein